MEDTRIIYESVQLSNGKGWGVDTFAIDRKAWSLAKSQLRIDATLSDISERAQTIKEWLQKGQSQ